jgi:hypothetical protein
MDSTGVFPSPNGVHILRKGFMLSLSLFLFPFITFAVDRAPDYVEYISDLVAAHAGPPVILSKDDVAATKATFKPPVEILIDAMTDSTNLRMSYAAKAVIFNWERNRTELRVDGGPAGGKHKPGAGGIPTNKFVSIHWVVTPTRQTIEVDGLTRYQHFGDYSKIDNPIAVFCAHGSQVTVKSIKVRQLPADSQ